MIVWMKLENFQHELKPNLSNSSNSQITSNQSNITITIQGIPRRNEFNLIHHYIITTFVLPIIKTPTNTIKFQYWVEIFGAIKND